ncbi:MAG TPA: ISC system 2Fe-2S type ferredoxin [Burkholderiaceae bacterium]|nr:ISC system 2Fe-2S type ferredoxin [Burkholderiaceae bacterium]
MPTIRVLPHEEICPNGATIVAQRGQSICRALLDGGVPIEHACELSCACTTCHVIVREGFRSLAPSEEDEDDLLDKAWGLTPLSRLSCQAIVAASDLVVEIPRYSINQVKEGK